MRRVDRGRLLQRARGPWRTPTPTRSPRRTVPATSRRARGPAAVMRSACSSSRRRRGLRGDGDMGRDRRLDLSGSSPVSTCATPAPPATRASARTAPTRRVTTSPPSTRASSSSSRTRSTTRSVSSAPSRATSAPAAAAWTGLTEGIPVAVGNVDAHVSAPAADAVAPGQMVAIMGTSTCHVMSLDVLAEVPGMCGVVDGGIVTGLLRLRGRPVRRRRHLRLVRRQPGALRPTR